MPAENHKRVLVVDDDPSLRLLLASLLSQRGLEVSTASDGHQAMDLMRGQRFAVVILDLLMPGTDGFQVLDELKRSDGSFTPVVLVLTGADRTIVERLDPQRIHGVVRKPFDPEELASVVVACAEIRGRSTFETMAIATVLAGSPFIAWLSR
jgi:CheY-like chemotaxis protein